MLEILGVDEITHEDILLVTELDLSNQNLRSIDDLYDFQNLKNLNLDNNHIYNLEVLKSLPNLKSVSVKGQTITETAISNSAEIISELFININDQFLIPESLINSGTRLGNELFWQMPEQTVPIFYDVATIYTLNEAFIEYDARVTIAYEHFEPKEIEDLDDIEVVRVSDSIQMDDKNLIIKINKILGKGNDVITVPTEEEMLSLPTDLDLSAVGSSDRIVNLNGLNNATHIERLDLSGNDITGDDELLKLEGMAIKHLDLSSFSGSTKTKTIKLEGLEQLESVYGGSKRLTHIVSIDLRNLPKLNSFEFSESVDGSGGYIHLENLPSLSKLDLGSEIQAWYLQPVSLYIKNLPNLAFKTHRVSDTKHWFLGINPMSITNLEIDGIPHLEYFEVKNLHPDAFGDDVTPSMTEYEPQSFQRVSFNNVENLKHLDLSKNSRMTDFSYSDLPNLELFVLDGTNMTSLSRFKDNDLPALKTFDLSNNKFDSMSELDYISHFPIETLIMKTAFTKNSKDFVIRDFDKLKNITFSVALTQTFDNITFSNLKSMEAINFIPVSAFDGAKNGKLLLEDMPNLKSINLNAGSRYNLRPKELELVNLPNLDFKAYDFSSSYHWYLGIDPGNLTKVTIDNIKELKTLDLKKVPAELKDASARSRNSGAATTITDLKISNVPNLNLINASNNKIQVPIFNNIPKLTHLDLSNNNIKSLEGLKTVAQMRTVTDLNISHNKLDSIEQLEYIREMPIKVLDLTESFSGTLEDLVIEGFSELEEVKLNNKDGESVVNVIFKDLPKYKEIVFPGVFHYRNSAEGTLHIENLPLLESVNLGAVQGFAEKRLSPKHLILKDLPLLEMKGVRSTINTYWFLGISPLNLETIEIDNLDSMKYLDFYNLPSDWYEEIVAGQTLEPINPDLKSLKVNNSNKLETIDAHNLKLDTFEANNLESLKSVNISNNKLVDETFKISNLEVLENFNFKDNKISNIEQFEALVENNTSSSLTINGDNNVIYDGTPLKLNHSNMKVSIMHQKPILPNVAYHVDAKGVYILEPFNNSFNSPYDIAYENVTDNGVVDGNKIIFRDLHDKTLQSFDFDWVSKETNAMGSYEFSGTTTRTIIYPIDDFEASLSANKTRATTKEVIEFTLDFKTLGKQDGIVSSVDLGLLNSSEGIIDKDSIVVSGVAYTVTKSTDFDGYIISLEDFIVGDEITVTYDVEVKSKNYGSYLSQEVIIANESYARKDILNEEVLLVETFLIEEEYINRANESVHLKNESYIYFGDGFVSNPTDVTGYIYLGYKIDDLEPVLDRNWPSFQSVEDAHSIKHIYGVVDPTDPSKELTYKVTETYKTRHGESLKGQVERNLPALAEVEFEETDISDHIYVGYILDGQELKTGMPKIDELDNDHTIEYVYGFGIPEKEVKIINNYVDEKGRTINPSNEITYFYYQSHITDQDPKLTDYVYLYYTLNESSEKHTGFVNLADLEEDFTVNYVFAVEDKDNPEEILKHTVTENFVNRIGDSIKPADFKEVHSLTDYVGKIQKIPGYVYLGYLDEDGTLVESNDTKTFVDVSKDMAVTYVYGIADPDDAEQELTHDVTVQYVNRLNESIKQPDTIPVNSLTDYVGEKKKVDGYVYIGYQIENETIVYGKDYPRKSKITDNLSVKYIYGVNDGNDKEKEHTITLNYATRKNVTVAPQKEIDVFENTDYQVLETNFANYVYVGYIIGAEDFVETDTFPEIVNVRSNHTIKLVYGIADDQNPDKEKTYTITEKYERRDRSSIKDNTTKTINAVTDYNGKADVIPGYIYVGYIINNEDFKETTDLPKLSNVSENASVTYVYGIEDTENPGQEKSYTITQKYVDRRFVEKHPEVVVNVYENDKYQSEVLPIDDYLYIGYKLNNNDIVWTRDILKIDGVKANHDVTFIYGKKDPSNPDQELTHNVKETYVNRAGLELAQPKSDDVTSDTLFNYEVKTIEDYLYVGYRLNGGSLKTGKPDNLYITEEVELEYLYGLKDSDNPNVEATVEVTQRYVDRKGRIKAQEEVNTYFVFETPVLNVKTIENYVFKEYILDGVKVDGGSIPDLQNISEDHVVAYIYGINDGHGEEQSYTITQEYLTRKKVSIKPNTEHTILADTDYNAAPVSINGYVYVGFQKEDEAFIETQSLPHYTDLNSHEKVALIYGIAKDDGSQEELKYKVLEKYENRIGDVIQSETKVDVNAMTDYIGSEKKISDYVYVGYKLKDGVFKETSEYPVLEDVDHDTEVTYVYGTEDSNNIGEELKHPITIKYVDRNNKTKKADDVFTVNDLEAFTVPQVKIEDYVYVGYRINDDFVSSKILPTIDSVKQSYTIELVYGKEDSKQEGEELIHTVTEKYQTRRYVQVDNDEFVEVYSDTDYEGIEHMIANYIYVGYRINDGDLIISKDYPVLENISEDITVTYVYGLVGEDGQELQHLITEHFIDIRNESIRDSKQVQIIDTESYYGDAVDFDDYVYVGYRLDDHDLVYSNQYPSIDQVESAHEVFYVYDFKEYETFTITELYVDVNGKPVAPTTMDSITEFETYEKNALNIINYKYLGYKVDQGILQEGHVKISEVQSNHTIEFVYQENTKPPVVNPDGGKDPDTGIRVEYINYLLIILIAAIYLVYNRKRKVQ